MKRVSLLVDAEAAVDEGTPLLGAGEQPTAFSSSRPELPPVREGYGAAASRKPPPQLDAEHFPGSSSSGAAHIPEADLIALNSPQESIASPQESFIVKSRSADNLAGPSYAEKGKARADVTSSFMGLQSGWLNQAGALASADERAAADFELMQRTFAAWRSLSTAQHVRRVRGSAGELPAHESASL